MAIQAEVYTAMQQLVRLILMVSVLILPTVILAENTSPYSEPFHKQGRGWYPSIYWSTGRNMGSYYFPNTNGTMFVEMKDSEWDHEANGLIYFYRPGNQWASEELEAPSYYINDEIIFNLRGGSYTIVELPAGTYDFTVRKSLLPLIGFEAFDDKLMMAVDLNLQADMGLQINAGSITYIRHSEVSLPAKLHPDLDPDDPMATADVQLVDKEQAMSEITKTRYLTHSFWHPNDSEFAKDILSGEMQEYGWFSVIWPWSNNFLFGFPIFYLPSDMYRELLGDETPPTLEEQLYRYADDKNAYLKEIVKRREIRRNWLAPWREPSNHLTLNEELILDRLEREALAGTIKKPVVTENRADKKRIKVREDDSPPWYRPFAELFKAPAEPEVAPPRVVDSERRERIDLIKQALN